MACIDHQPPVKILVVDDHVLVREGLCQVLKGIDESVCVLQAGTCAQAFAAAQSHADLDLVLLDYHLPDMNGLDALGIFGQRHPELPIIMLSGSVNASVMRQVVRSGAAGFVTKSSLSEELLRAIRQVLDGGVYVPQELDHPNAPGLLPDESSDKPALTQRQELVLRGLIDGRSNREISESLNISDETVKTHVTAILRHFSVQNRTQAVVAAARRGYLGSSNL
ncbi:MAG: response regulator transcription factor [Burkholderiales bacterium]|nr:response regulator transcription factor [Burkholderiales bacterium]